MITDMYSGLAKAYGIHTVLSFLSQTTLYPVIFSHPHTVHLHCDNNGVIEWIQNTPSTLHSQEAIHDNYPILANIKHQLQAMPMIQGSFHHVKATKKRMADCKLTLPEKLNIDYDACASGMAPLPMHSPICVNLLTNASYPHLMIKDECNIYSMMQPQTSPILGT